MAAGVDDVPTRQSRELPIDSYYYDVFLNNGDPLRKKDHLP